MTFTSKENIVIIIIVIIILYFVFYNKENFTSNKYMNLIEPNIDFDATYNSNNPWLEMNIENNILNEVAKEYQKENPFNTTIIPEQYNVNNKLTKLQKEMDKEDVLINNVRRNNIEKFANFETSYVNQNSNIFETQVDKIAQLRTSLDYDYSKFGNTIWEAYDNLLSTPFTQYQTDTPPNWLLGTGKDTFNSHYAPLQTINYKINNQELG